MVYNFNDKDDIYAQVGAYLDSISKPKNFQVNTLKPKGQPGKNVKSMREYRMQLINKTIDGSKDYIDFLNRELSKVDSITDLKYNQISPNSSKFSSYSFKIQNKEFDIVIAKGANKGENFEKQTVNNLATYFKTRTDKEYADLINLMNKANPEFASVDIVKVAQRTGSTKKEGVAIEKLGEIIGDIVLTDSTGKDWYISLKDINGDTFSSYSGASSLFDAYGMLKPLSEGAKFLNAFGVDLNQVQRGFDERKGIKHPRSSFPVQKADVLKLKAIFERAWGMNYFYVRKTFNGWKVFWLDKRKLMLLTSGIKVTNISYPSKSTKQITITAESAGGFQKYKIEIRNSKAGEYPNDIKFKVMK